MADAALQLLREAIGAKKSALAEGNIFAQIAFDGEENRLGWVIPPAYEALASAQARFLEKNKEYKEFVFTGMGGSINGVKALFTLHGKKNFHTVNSIDPRALQELLTRISYARDVKVLPISKSGSTSETQLVAHALRSLFTRDWEKHFLWISDAPARKKLDALGWQGAGLFPLQVDAQTDIGGRFSCPHTFVFLGALALLYSKEEIASLWQRYRPYHETLLSRALAAAAQFKEKPNAYFALKVKKPLDVILHTWLIQLFQESLGSKKEHFPVKTLIFDERERLREGFDVIEYASETDDVALSFLHTIYFFEAFIAFFSYFKKIVFVTQEYVERYKQKEKELLQTKPSLPPSRSLGDIVGAAAGPARDKKFIEVVLFFYPEKDELEYIERKFQERFPEKKVFCFEGSDWNHHSYQASFLAQDTHYIFLTRDSYIQSVDPLPREIVAQGILQLRSIAEATYQTLKDKSVYYALAR
jgi:hypothetical protein